MKVRVLGCSGAIAKDCRTTSFLVDDDVLIVLAQLLHLFLDIVVQSGQVNEAFAAQALSVIKEGGLDINKINPNGGAVALGHPLGCTGAKLTASVIRELSRRKARYGMVTMCVGGGMGAAGIFEKL